LGDFATYGRLGSGVCDKFEAAVHVFHESGAVFYPVTAVHISQAVDGLDHRLVDVSADDSVAALRAGVLDRHLLELAHVGYGILDAFLQVSAEAPVREIEKVPDSVDNVVEPDRPIVCPASHMHQPDWDVCVELVPVNDKVALAVGRYVDVLMLDRDVPEDKVEQKFEEVIVVARREDDLRALAPLAENLLDHIIVGLRPEPLPLKRPAVDEISDETQHLRFKGREEMQECPIVRKGITQVVIGCPHASIMGHTN